MHAVLVKVSIQDREAAQRELQEQVIPRVSQAPGFVAGYWTSLVDDQGRGESLVVFESEEAARTMASVVQSQPPANVTLEGVEVCEVVASA